MSKLHAVLSPSSAHRWSSCTASVIAAATAPAEPDEGSEAARLGTCGHQILEDLLNDPAIDPQSFLGREFWSIDRDEHWCEDWPHADVAPEHVVTVDQELIDAVLSAHRFVVEQAALIGGTITAEQSVPIGHITGEDDAYGTSDVVITAGDTIAIFDLKLGRRRVDAYEVLQPAGEDIITGEHVPEVVRPNLQLSMYALGVIELMRETRTFKRVRLVILQPFLSHVSEWSGKIEELLAVGKWLSVKAEETRTQPVFRPNAENCMYCPMSGRCAAQTAAVAAAALEGFEDVETAKPRPAPSDMELGDAYALVPLVNVWAKAVEVRVRDHLSAGLPVLRSDGIGYKLVEGRLGARAWTDEAEAEEALKRMRLKESQIYRRKLISPTQAEGLAKVKKPKKGEEAVKPPLGKTQWNRLQSYITQERGAPAIALQTDPRPALAAAADGFEDVPPADNSDLF